MTIKRLVSYLLVSFSLFIFSCHNNEEEIKTPEIPVNTRVFPDYHIALDSIVRTKEGIVCGVELGDSKAKIPAHEVQQAFESDATHVTFEQKIDSITKYNITYVFENDSIAEIEVLIMSENADEGVQILNDLKNYYTQKYTAPLMDKGYFVFNCFDSKKKNFVITLTDNSGASNSVIDMYVYKEK